MLAMVSIKDCTREFDKEYSYLIPEEMQESIKPGVRVIVPFGRSDKPMEGYVLEVRQEETAFELKSITKVLDDVPALREDMLALSRWMKKRYLCTISDAIRCMLPPGIGVKALRVVRLTGLPTAEEQEKERILGLLQEEDGCCEYTVLRDAAGSKSFSDRLRRLQKNGKIEILEQFDTGVCRKTVRVARLALPPDQMQLQLEEGRIKRIQQIRVLEMLLDNPYISTADLVRFAGVSAGVLNTLARYGYLTFEEVEVTRDPVGHREFARTYPLVPTSGQQPVLSAIMPVLEEKRFEEILLHGVTGSGKTEVYLQVIQHCLDQERQAIILVPEISLTPQMVDRFKGRFGERVAVLHSRLSIGERYDQWRLIRDGAIQVVVGARSAVFAPLQRLGIVIMDEEHENSYKSEITPRYHAREVARERCRTHGAILLYGSATPSVETYYRAKQGEIRLLEMGERANNLLMPQVEIVDMRKELEQGNRSIFSHKLMEEIQANLSAAQQTILFLNRRGYASFVMCRSCGLALKCTHCHVTLTYHQKEDRLICHYCGYTLKAPKICPKCGSLHIRHFGTGTQRVEEEIRKHFVGASVLRMDMDTTSGKNGHEAILEAFRKENVNVLVGTQMVAKGHDFPNVTLVGVLAADSMLNQGDYLASERTFQLITQVAGRAGRGELPGRVVIQTYNTEDYSIVNACSHDYSGFYRQEIRAREMLCHPPFRTLANVIVSGPCDREAYEACKEFVTLVSSLDKEERLELLGPSRSPLSRINNSYRWRLIIKALDADNLVELLTEASDKFQRKKRKGNVRLTVDINPVNLL